MTHMALDPDTSGRTPPWLVGRRGDVRLRRRPRERGAAARGAARRRARSCASSASRTRSSASTADAQAAAYAPARAPRRRSSRSTAREGLFELYDAFNDPTIARPAVRGDDRSRASPHRRHVARRARGCRRRRLSARRPPPARCQAERMPELPEVETIRRHLAPHVEGRVLTRLEVLDERWCRPVAGAEVAAAVEGRRVEALARRGKYLIWELEDDVHLMVHLRMTGTLLLDPPEPPRHRRVRFGFDDGRGSSSTTRAASAPASWRSAATRATRSSPRGWGSSRSRPASPARTCTRSRASSRAPVKAFLLDQRKIAGVGNIYADEALFRARIHPLRPARGSAASRSRRCATAWSRRSRRGSPPRARRSTTSAIPTASRAPSRTAS